MKKLFAILAVGVVFASCGNAETTTSTTDSLRIADSTKAADSAAAAASAMDTAKAAMDTAKKM